MISLEANLVLRTKLAGWLSPATCGWQCATNNLHQMLRWNLLAKSVTVAFFRPSAGTQERVQVVAGRRQTLVCEHASEMAHVSDTFEAVQA